MAQKLFILLFVLLSFSQVFASDADTINKTNKQGKRVGYWVLTESNAPTTLNSNSRRKEGYYVNGRKNGAWVFYYDDAKTIRLIGEFKDNRPGGAYFRFNKKGDITQASTVTNQIRNNQQYESFNNFFACKMLFHNRETVAGLVFFKPKVFQVPYSYQFWMEEDLEENKSINARVNFNWLNASYAQLYANYLQIRAPKNTKVQNPSLKNVANRINRIQVAETTLVKPRPNELAPPFVNDPRVAEGAIFLPNGFNKLYTKSNEIWIDGYFKNGQLKDGKVFLYDHDGVLLKVRVYKNSKYVSDGGL